MSEIKRERAILNTTINKEVLDNFREHCKQINCPMNTVLEIFMEQFANEQFTFRLAKNKITLDI